MAPRWVRPILLLALAGAAAAPAPAQEAQITVFRSAGGVPACVGTGPDRRCEGQLPDFWCWIHQRALMCRLDGDRQLRPDWTARCEFSTGHAFILRATGRAVRGCEEPPGLPDETPVLAVGAAWRRTGIRCENSAGTLHCVNRSGRGFRIHPRRQEVF